MSGGLDAPVARVERALFHYRTLKDGLHAGVDHKLRPVSVERLSDGLEYRFHIGEIEPLDPTWPLIVGEAYYNLRAALDHLVYQLHVRHFRGTVPIDVAERSAFPVRAKPRKDTSGRFIPTNRWREIQHLGIREQRAIEWLQPYKGWGDQYPPRTEIGQMRRAVFDVHTLNIFDKHRDLHLVHPMAQSVLQPDFPAHLGFKQHPAFGIELRSNACVDRWTFRRSPPTDQMEMHPGIYTGVGIDLGSGDRIDVIPHLGGSILGIAMAIDRFHGRFQPFSRPPLDLSTVRRTVG